MNKISFKKWSMAGMLAATLMLGSCAVPQDVTYMQDFDASTVIESAQKTQMRLAPGDKVMIVVHSKDPALSALFNLPVVTSRLESNSPYNGSSAKSRQYSNSEGMSSYTVSPEGNIDFPVLGTLHVEGMSRSELTGFIKGELIGRDLIKDPTVTVEMMNTGITLLGEFNNPGRYDLNRDDISLLEAMALAGDMTINGQRQNVKVIRTDKYGKTQVHLVDLTKGAELMKSPVYYLQQNDIVYVEPNNYKKRQTTVNGNTALSASFWISIASLLTSMAVFVIPRR